MESSKLDGNNEVDTMRNMGLPTSFHTSRTEKLDKEVL